MAQITDFDALGVNAKPESRNPLARRAGLPVRPAADQNLRRKILALIPRLTRYARVLTRDAVAAEDLVQDCLARALGKIHLWEEGTDLRAWLFTILYHQHVSLARRNARQRAGIESQKSQRGSLRSPEQTVRLELRDLERAIARLPEEQRSLILLVGLEGMRYEEAASAANIPVGTVRSRVARGRENLRTMTELFPGRHSKRPGGATNRDNPRDAETLGDDFQDVVATSHPGPKPREVLRGARSASAQDRRASPLGVSRV